MKPTLSDYSRFTGTEMIIVNGIETYGKWSGYSFLKQRPPDDKIGVFRVTSALEGRPDLISASVYNTPLLSWVLIAFNNARGVLNWPRTGDRVEYPLEEIVMPEVLS